MNIDALSPVNSSQVTTGELSVSPSNAEVSNFDFSKLIAGGIQSLDRNVSISEATLAGYIINGDISTHDLMITMEKARHSMQIAVELRNRVVEAYQEITKLQV